MSESDPNCSALVAPLCAGANPDRCSFPCPRCGIAENELCRDDEAYQAQYQLRLDHAGITPEDAAAKTTPEALDCLEAMLRKATRGPWSTSDDNYRDPHYRGNGAIWVFSELDCDTHPIADCSCNHTCRMEWDQQDNAAFIAAADPPTVLALIRRIRKLESEIHERK